MSFEEGSTPQTTINGVTYSLRPLTPDVALKHGTKLAAVIAGPAVQKAAADFTLPEEGFDLGTLVQPLGNLVGEALRHLDHPDVQLAVNAVFATACIVQTGADGVPVEVELGPTWKAHFLGKTGSMVQFLKWACQEQYGDFFGAMLGSPLAALKGQLESLASSALAKRAGASRST